MESFQPNPPVDRRKLFGFSATISLFCGLGVSYFHKNMGRGINLVVCSIGAVPDTAELVEQLWRKQDPRLFYDKLITVSPLLLGVMRDNVQDKKIYGYTERALFIINRDREESFERVKSDAIGRYKFLDHLLNHSAKQIYYEGEGYDVIVHYIILKDYGSVSAEDVLAEYAERLRTLYGLPAVSERPDLYEKFLDYAVGILGDPYRYELYKQLRFNRERMEELVKAARGKAAVVSNILRECLGLREAGKTGRIIQ